MCAQAVPSKTSASPVKSAAIFGGLPTASEETADACARLNVNGSERWAGKLGDAASELEMPAAGVGSAAREALADGAGGAPSSECDFDGVRDAPAQPRLAAAVARTTRNLLDE